MESKKKMMLSVIMLFLLVVVTIGVTFAVFSFSKEGTVENTLETSTIVLTYTEGKTGIMLNEAYPISDEKGKVLTGENNVFDFTVQATLGTSTVISYEVAAVKLPINDVTALLDNEVKLYLEKAVDPDTTYQEVLSPSNFHPIENPTEVGSPVGSMILDSGAFYTKGITIHHYRLRMWVDESAIIPSGESRKYGVKVNVYAKQLLSDNFTDESCFTFDSSTGTINDYDDNCPKDVVIPYTIDGVMVKTIGAHRAEGAFQNKQLTSVIIPNSVTTIKNYAFYNNQLTNVSIPSSVTLIELGAFIKNQLPDSQAFIYNRNENGSIDYTSLNSYGGAKKENVIIPNHIKIIGNNAFFDNQLTSVTIGDNVTTIGREAFDHNELTTIIIPNSVVSIGSHSFSNNQLTNVVISNNLTVIEYGTFSHNRLTSITIPDNITTIGEGAFYDNQIVNVIIPNHVVDIGNSAFLKSSSSNPNLTTIINLTGRSFNWRNITDSGIQESFVTGVLSHSLGDIVITGE